MLATVMAAAIGWACRAGPSTKLFRSTTLGLEQLDIIVPDPAASARCSRYLQSALLSTRARQLRTSCFSRAPRRSKVGTRLGAAVSGRRRVTTACWPPSTRAVMAEPSAGAGLRCAAAGPRAVARSRWSRTAAFPSSPGLSPQLSHRRSRPNRLTLKPRGVDHMLLRVSMREKSLPTTIMYWTAAERPTAPSGCLVSLAQTRVLVSAAVHPCAAIAHYASRLHRSNPARSRHGCAS